MIASPENLEFRRKVASYGGLSPLTIAQKIGCDVKRVYDAQRYMRNHSADPERIIDASPFNKAILNKAYCSSKFLVKESGKRIFKYDTHGMPQSCGIETVAKVFGFIPELPAYD